jgi:hypothetical protein
LRFFAFYSHCIDTGTAITREDILYPCKTTQKTSCSGTCAVRYNNNWIPRFFKDAPAGTAGVVLTDSVGCVGNTLPTTLINKLGALPTPACYTKTIETNAPPDYIRYIWTSNNVTVAAQGLDGTFFEFFIIGTALTPGVTYPIATCALDATLSACYDFTKFDSLNCGTISCTAPTDVAFVIDEQVGITTTGFSQYYKGFVSATINGFSSLAQFGLTWTNNLAPLLQPAGSLTTSRTSLANYIASRVQKLGASDFALSIKTTIGTYWPSAKVTNVVLKT